MSGGIGTVALVGGLLIAAAILFAVISNRRRSNHDRRRTEEGTANLYRDIDRQDQATDPDKKPY